jgi:hypothetical protein
MTHLLRSLHSTKEMSLPVRPPTLLRAFRALDAAFEIAGPAELVTLVRPSEAFDTVDEAVSLAFAAVSAVVEACLCCRLRKCRVCRRAVLVANVPDMTWTRAVKLVKTAKELQQVALRQLHLRQERVVVAVIVW